MAAPRSSITRKRLTQLLTGMRRKRIVVVGDAMLDVYLGGDVERISPEAPVPVVKVRERRYAMGGAANVAANVAATGATVTLVAAAGDDSAGHRLRTMLEVIGADSKALIRTKRPTTCKTRVVARAQQMLRFDEEDDGDLPGREVQKVLDIMLPLLAKGQAIDMPDLLERTIAELGKPVVFPIREYWLDIGRADDLAKANLDFDDIFE